MPDEFLGLSWAALDISGLGDGPKQPPSGKLGPSISSSSSKVSLLLRVAWLEAGEPPLVLPGLGGREASEREAGLVRDCFLDGPGGLHWGDDSLPSGVARSQVSCLLSWLGWPWLYGATVPHCTELYCPVPHSTELYWLVWLSWLT